MTITELIELLIIAAMVVGAYFFLRLILYAPLGGDREDAPKRTTVQQVRHVTPLRLSQARRRAQRQNHLQ